MRLPKDTLFSDTVLKLSINKKIDDRLTMINTVYKGYVNNAYKPLKDILNSNVDTIAKSLISDKLMTLELPIEQSLNIEKKQNYIKSLLFDIAFITDDTDVPYKLFKAGKKSYEVDNGAVDEFVNKSLYKSITDSKEIKKYNELQNAINLLLQEIPKNKSQYNTLFKSLLILDNHNAQISYRGFKNINSMK